jgi:predicted nucleotidyltransferase
MDLNQLVKEKREEILQIAAKHGAYNVRLFGSVARGEAGPESDVDFLIEMEEGRSLFDLADLLADLQDLLNCKVDISEPEGLHWFIRDQILKEAVFL